MKWFGNPKQRTTNMLEVLPSENIPWWERKAEFDEAKKVLIGLRVRLLGVKRRENEIGIIRKVYIQQPRFSRRGGKISPRIIAVVDFDRGCNAVTIQSLVSVDQLKTDNPFLLGHKERGKKNDYQNT